jgi:hypothetical protein
MSLIGVGDGRLSAWVWDDTYGSFRTIGDQSDDSPNEVHIVRNQVRTDDWT